MMDVNGIQNPNLKIEKTLWAEGYKHIMGLDEVGRGCLAGPVVAAGVILDPQKPISGITDSKQVKTHVERMALAGEIKEKALFWAIKECSHEEIDRHNILCASLMAMEKCVSQSGVEPDFLLVDGNKCFPTIIPHRCVVKGDMLSASIGAASLLAKVYRDELMFGLHGLYPWYGWDTNVGYPTLAHYRGLSKHGISPVHRKSFNLRTTKELVSDESDGQNRA